MKTAFWFRLRLRRYDQVESGSSETQVEAEELNQSQSVGTCIVIGFGKRIKKTLKELFLFLYWSYLSSVLIQRVHGGTEGKAVADPGEGRGEPAPLIFIPKWGPKGRKKNFETAPPPLSQGLDDRPTPSPIIWRSRFATGKGVPISEVADIKAKNANIAFFSYSFPSLMWFSTLSGAKKLFYGPFLLQGSFANNRLDILSFQDSTSKQRLQEYFFYLNVLSFH